MNDLQDIPLHGGQEQLFRLGTVGGLAQYPHQFDCGGFGGHIVRFQHTGQGFGRAAKALPGVLEAHDMTPEATAVKLMWVLGQTTDRAEAEKLFLTPVQWDIL